jgi:hypothetical protein
VVRLSRHHLAWRRRDLGSVYRRVAALVAALRLMCLEEAAAGELAGLVPQRDQAPQVDGDVVGLALVRILYLCVQWARTPSRLACSDSSGLARRIQLVISRSLGGAGAAGGAQARALQGLRYAQTVA